MVRLSNTSRQTFDTIIVLGSPADSDGNPSPLMLDRITEGVHEYERGVAPRILVTGGPAHNAFVEAEVMARVAHAEGVPIPNILLETHAKDTLQNACFSKRILAEHGWHSAEIVSSAAHLPRTAMIFSHLNHADRPNKFEWRTHAAPDDQAPGYSGTIQSILEVLKTARYLVWARWTESCE